MFTQPQLIQDDSQIQVVVCTGKVVGTVTGVIAANSQQTQVVTPATPGLGITNAVLGDEVLVWLDASKNAVTVSGYVNAAGSITIVYNNNSAGGVTVGAHNIYFVVLRGVGAVYTAGVAPQFPGDAFSPQSGSP